MDIINKHYNSLNIFNKLINETSDKVITDVSLSYFAAFINNKFSKGSKTIFIVMPNLSKAEEMYNLLSSIVSKEDLLFYPEDEFLTSLLNISLETFTIERIYTIKELLKEDKKIVVLNDVAAYKKIRVKKAFKEAYITLEENNIINVAELLLKLVNNGYKREYTVINKGEFSVRGSIIDIFPIDSDKPFRIDLFDNEIETIKYFDPKTQLSVGRVSKIEIMPKVELVFSDEEKEVAINNIEKDLNSFSLKAESKILMNKEVDDLYNRINLDHLKQYISYFEYSSLFDYKDDKEIYVYDFDKIQINYQRMEEDLIVYKKENSAYDLKDFYYNFDYLNMYQLKHLKSFYNENNKISMHSRDVTNYMGRDDLFLDEVLNNKKTAVISFTGEIRLNKFKDLLENKNIKYNINSEKVENNKINILYPFFLLSFEMYEDNIVFIDESYLYDYKPHLKQTNYRSTLIDTIKITDLDELKVGDYVVHYDYGIGVYAGIKTMELSHDKRDYMHIKYEGTDYLYVPVDKLDLVLKYASKEGMTPKLTKLGTNQWKTTKKRIKDKLSDLSDRLFKLYKERQDKEGFVFNKEDVMHEEFKKEFMYEETKDQLKAINDVISDMESNKVMDRLIIGDVGYGKTEVAMRASFKAVYSNKQVSYLVPTTLLARQHYLLFKERFEKYGINVRLLSRFVSAKETKETLVNLEKGLVDIVVGTHRLLSNDIKYKDLGLLIIDEEQRFGVLHKEKIKEIKTNVDTLSLTATPIPRTLQMGLVGIKDLSMIETPPKNRYPIQTYILERHDSIIKEAILKEIARGGQVFYLYNRVSDIEKIVHKINTLIPGLNVGVAHGQMNKNKLEEVMRHFINGNYDVLVSTTIIETGIDIPNANTLIVHDADMLGLAQLYQIRGRVGRSNKLAYSYMLYGKGKELKEEAFKRLKTIKDFESLGSGFKIAMRDLSIRGAGDILGKEQSGFIDTIGLEMYLKMLEEVVNEKKGIKTPKKLDDEILLSKRHINKKYISLDEIRLQIHKRIAKVNNFNDIDNLVIELEDRFGKLDDELLDYMYEKLLTKYLERLQVEKVIKTTTELTLILPIKITEEINGAVLFNATNDVEGKIKLSYLNKRINITLIYEENQNPLKQMINYLDLIINEGVYNSIEKPS